jgi:hypothetical protein
MKKSSIFILSGGAVLLVFVGYLLGMYTKNVFVYKTEIDIPATLLSFLSLIMTLALAFWVTNVLERRVSNERSGKDLIIARINDLYSVMNDCSDRVSSNSLRYIEAVSTLKRILMTIKAIDSIIVSEDLVFEFEGTYRQDLNDELELLRELMTYTPYSMIEEFDEQVAIKVVDGILYFSRDRIQEIVASFDKLRNQVLKYQLAVNRG